MRTRTVTRHMPKEQQCIADFNADFESGLPRKYDGLFWKITSKGQAGSRYEYTFTGGFQDLAGYAKAFSADEDQMETQSIEVVISNTIGEVLDRMWRRSLISIASEVFNGHTLRDRGIHPDSRIEIIDCDAKEATATYRFTVTRPEIKPKAKPSIKPSIANVDSIKPAELTRPDIVYIAGAISGDVESNRHKFAAAKHQLLASSKNVTVLNPAELPDGLTQAQYMSICLPMVMAADTIYMLKGWESSSGALAEHALADKLKINIEYEGEYDIS